jgi:threonine dehydrogenase-like Zn-dependent dehydrogenase
VQTAVRIAAPGGTVRLVGMPQGPVTFESALAIIKEVQLLSGWIYLPTEFAMAIELLASGSIDVDSLTTAVLPIESFHEATAALRTPDQTMKVLIKTAG